MSETPPLSADERRQLRLFTRCVFELVHRPFVQSIMRGQKASMTLLEAGTEEGQFPEFDFELFRSFMLDFRQLAISKSEDIYLFKIKNILYRLLPDSRSQLEAIHRFIQTVLDPKGSTAPGEYRAIDILKAMVNGDLFHQAKDREELAEKLRTVQRDRLLFFLGFLIRDTLICCNGLVRLILEHNLLSQRELPPGLLNEGVSDRE